MPETPTCALVLTKQLTERFHDRVLARPVGVRHVTLLDEPYKLTIRTYIEGEGKVEAVVHGFFPESGRLGIAFDGNSSVAKHRVTMPIEGNQGIEIVTNPYED